MLETVKRFFLSVGFETLTFTTADEHDKIIAYTSQLAHIVSNAYVKSPTALQRKGIDAAHATDIARIANGSYLAALKKIDDSEENQQELRDFIALFRDAYTVGVLKDPQKKYESLKRLRQWSLDMADSKVGREKQKHFLQYAQQQVRENYIRNIGQAELNYQLEAERDFSVKFAPFIHDGNVEGIMNQLDLAERQIEQNGNAKMIFFDLCLQMIILIKKAKQ